MPQCYSKFLHMLTQLLNFFDCWYNMASGIITISFSHNEYGCPLSFDHTVWMLSPLSVCVHVHACGHTHRTILTNIICVFNFILVWSPVGTLELAQSVCPVWRFWLAQDTWCSHINTR